MPRIPEPGIERLKSKVSVERLVEASGIELKGPWGQGALGSKGPWGQVSPFASSRCTSSRAVTMAIPA